jgi:hypothetical protein
MGFRHLQPLQSRNRFPGVETSQNRKELETTRRYGPVVLKWASALVLAYLTLFYWADSAVRLFLNLPHARLEPGPALFTLFLTLRVWWHRSVFSWSLSLGALAGLAMEWRPVLVLLPLAAAAALAFLYRHRPAGRTVLARRRPIPWPVALSADDRFLHLHVLGPTGSGKSSSVLMPLIAQDIVHGYGLFVLDPKGDLADSAYWTAKSRGRPLIRLNPLDDQCPHVNPLSGPSDQAAEGLAWCLDRIAGGSHPYYAVAARVQLLHAVRVVKAAFDEQADIGQLLRFFRDQPLQQQMVREAGDEASRAFFQQLWVRRSGQSQEDRQGLLNRLELFWANPAVRRTLSAPADFTWDEVLQDGWVVTATLSLAQLGDSAGALGSLFWHGLAQAAYRRRPGVRHPPFFAYLDEFHQWVSEDFGDFLALARGHQVGLTIAHQDLGQLSPALTEAVIANARHRVILPGTAGDDVARFRKAAAPHPVDERLRYFPRGRALVQVTTRGRLRPPWIAKVSHLALTAKGRPRGSAR